MYEAPDRFKRMTAARLPDGESLGITSDPIEVASSPLKDVQLISRAQLAPFFAAANVVAAGMMIAALWGGGETMYLLPWVATVALANFVAMQVARTQAITHIGRSGRQVPEWLMVGEVVGRGLIWLSLPISLFPSMAPGAPEASTSTAAISGAISG